MKLGVSIKTIKQSYAAIKDLSMQELKELDLSYILHDFGIQTKLYRSLKQRVIAFLISSASVSPCPSAVQINLGSLVVKSRI